MCNVLAAIKTAKYFDLGPDDVILTVSTDGGEMYGSEVDKALRRYFGNRFDAIAAGEVWGRSLAAATTDNLLELSHADRKRVFNLGFSPGLSSRASRSRNSLCGRGSISGMACWI